MNKYEQLYKKLQDILDWCEEMDMDPPSHIEYDMSNLRENIRMIKKMETV
jgi:hypothetical protein